MRALACALATAAALLLLAGCGEDDEAPPRGRAVPVGTALTVTADPDGRGPRAARTARLRCVPGRSGPAACGTIERVPRATWRPVPPNRACTEIYGGPQTARITGRIRGRRIDATFSRQNGCEIARWDAVARLLALTGVRPGVG